MTILVLVLAVVFSTIVAVHEHDHKGSSLPPQLSREHIRIPTV